MNIKDAFEKQNNFLGTDYVDSVAILKGADNHPLITIAIPTYKRCEILKQTINSALDQQSMVPYEIIVVDNNPERFCETERMITADYSNIENLSYYKNVQNIGLFGNWNRCFQLAHGKWVVLLHDDDLIFDDFLYKSISYLTRFSDCVVLKPLMYKWLDNGKLYCKRPLKRSFFTPKYSFYCALDYVFLGNFVGSPTGCFFLKDYVLQRGGFSLSVYPSADTGFLLSAAMDKKVLLLNDFWGARRIGQNESLKPETEACFLDARYSFISYLTRHYRIQWILGKRYVAYCIQEYRKSLSASSADVMKEVLPEIGRTEALMYGILIAVYKLFKRIRVWFQYNLIKWKL